MIELDGARLREKEEAYPYLREKLGLPGTGTVFLLDVKTGSIRQRRIRKYFLVGMVQPILGAALFFLWCFAML